jgi:hypothetical protein
MFIRGANADPHKDGHHLRHGSPTDIIARAPRRRPARATKPRSAPLRRYRLARLRLDGRGAPARYEQVKRA